MSDPLALAVDQVKLAEERRRRAFAVGDRGPLVLTSKLPPRFLPGDIVIDLPSGQVARIERMLSLNSNADTVFEVTLSDGNGMNRHASQLEKPRPAALPTAVR